MLLYRGYTVLAGLVAMRGQAIKSALLINDSWIAVLMAG